MNDSCVRWICLYISGYVYATYSHSLHIASMCLRSQQSELCTELWYLIASMIVCGWNRSSVDSVKHFMVFIWLRLAPCFAASWAYVVLCRIVCDLVFVQRSVSLLARLELIHSLSVVVVDWSAVDVVHDQSKSVSETFVGRSITLLPVSSTCEVTTMRRHSELYAAGHSRIRCLRISEVM